jgi:transcriptional regulator with XRE-family HTH domain
MAGMSVDLVQFGLAVRDIRRDAGLTQQELGDRLGISNVAISQIENAKTAPALAKVVEIADALSVSLGVLFGDPLAVAEHTVAQVRAQVRALGYDLALIPREDA